MAKDPAARYQFVDELLVDLRQLQKGAPVSVTGRPLRRRTVVVDLSKVAALRLISRQTAMKYKGSRKSLQEIARELGVGAVVGGSVTRETGRVRVTAQLTDAVTDRNLWAETYERDFTSVLALQGEVARAIAGKISVKLRPVEESRLQQKRKVNPETYEAYLRGIFWLNKARGTPDAVRKGLGYLHAAVEKDPGDPLAYAGLALGYIAAAHGPDPPEDALLRAKSAAETAVRLDDSLAEAHAALGFLKIEIDPTYPVSYFNQGLIYSS